jgi:hypothetical protein
MGTLALFLLLMGKLLIFLVKYDANYNYRVFFVVVVLIVDIFPFFPFPSPPSSPLLSLPPAPHSLSFSLLGQSLYVVRAGLKLTM